MTETPEQKASVLKGLVSLFRTEDPMASMTHGFERMVELVVELVHEGGRKVFDEPEADGYRRRMEEKDHEVNDLERRIRKQVIAHLTLSSIKHDVAFGLLLMAVTREVERIGDYAKHLADIYHAGGGPVPAAGDATADELRALRTEVEALAAKVGPVFATEDRDAASALVDEGTALSHRADGLLGAIAQGGYDGPTAMTLTLVSRYYMRIAAHLTTVVNGVVSPLHELNYHDEKSLTD